MRECHGHVCVSDPFCDLPTICQWRPHFSGCFPRFVSRLSKAGQASFHFPTFFICSKTWTKVGQIVGSGCRHKIKYSNSSLFPLEFTSWMPWALPPIPKKALISFVFCLYQWKFHTTFVELITCLGHATKRFPQFFTCITEVNFPRQFITLLLESCVTTR